MAAAFAALGDHSERSALFHFSCESYACHNGNNLDSGFRPLSHVLSGITGACGNDLYAFFNNNLGNLVRKRAHEHDVDAEGLVCQFLTLLNFSSELFAV